MSVLSKTIFSIINWQNSLSKHAHHRLNNNLRQEVIWQDESIKFQKLFKVRPPFLRRPGIGFLDFIDTKSIWIKFPKTPAENLSPPRPPLPPVLQAESAPGCTTWKVPLHNVQEIILFTSTQCPWCSPTTMPHWAIAHVAHITNCPCRGGSKSKNQGKH